MSCTECTTSAPAVVAGRSNVVCDCVVSVGAAGGSYGPASRHCCRPVHLPQAQSAAAVACYETAHSSLCCELCVMLSLSISSKLPVVGFTFSAVWVAPLPSNRHRSNDDCLEGKRKNYLVCSVQYCAQQLCTVQCTHIN